MIEIRYVDFKNKDWNYLKIETKEKTILLIKKRPTAPTVDHHNKCVHK